MIKKHASFIAEGEKLMQFSDDLSKQTWAIIINQYGEIIGRGWNHLQFNLDLKAVQMFGNPDFLDFYNTTYNTDYKSDMIKNPRDVLEFCNQSPFKGNIAMEHAERAAIQDAAKKGHALAGATMYAGWYPCTPCANAIIGSGIKNLYIVEGPDYSNKKWAMNWKMAEILLKLNNVNTTILGR